MADDRLAWKFRRAARQRLVAVQLLLDHELGFEAVYLAGYVVECGLKALLLDRTPEAQRVDLVDTAYRGRRGHDLNELVRLLYLRNCRMPDEILNHMSRVRRWTTALRYEPGNVLRGDAVEFVQATREMLDWTERSA